VQLSTNEYFRRMLRPMGPNIESVNFFAGGAAGATAVFTTYPLDLARARLALLYQQGVTNQSMYGIMKEVYVKDGLRALWTGAGISMTGAGVYCGIKFASYDVCKDICSSLPQWVSLVIHSTSVARLEESSPHGG